VEDIRGRDPEGNIKRLKDFLDECRKASISNESGNIEIEARFGQSQGNSFESGMKSADFNRVVHLLESTPRIQASPLLEEHNYLYHQNKLSKRIIQSANGNLRADQKEKFSHAHFASLSTQVLYTLRIAGARETELPAPAAVEPGWNRHRHKRRREFRLDNSGWCIHATEVIAKSSESNLESVSYEVELELPLVGSSLSNADTERQMNELNEGISFLLHVLVRGRQGANTLAWVPPTRIELESRLKQHTSAAAYAPTAAPSTAPYAPYVPHPNLHPDSHYQRSPNGTYRGSAQAATGPQPTNGSHAPYAPMDGAYNGQYASSSAFDRSASSSAAAHPSHAAGASSDPFSSIRLEPIRDSAQSRRIRDLLDSCKPRGSGGGGKNDFWGTMPISFSRKHMSSLVDEDYHVSEKTDGVRYLMVISADIGGVVFVNRSGHYFSVSDFGAVSGFSNAFHNTVLDGELVIHNRQKHPYFLLFDIVRLKGETVSHLHLPERLKFIGDFIGSFRHKFPDTRNHPFGILGKTVMPKSKLSNITKLIATLQDGTRVYTEGDGSKRCHLTDGLIFTPTKLPYIFGTCYSMYKWKYVDLQSIDFLLRFESPLDSYAHPSSATDRHRKVELHINMGQGKVARCKTTELLQSDFERLASDLASNHIDFRCDRIIAEMAFEPKESTWRYHRLRTDKKNPNHISIAFDTMEAIAENVTIEDILAVLPTK
jgi:hypothetical protein